MDEARARALVEEGIAEMGVDPQGPWTPMCYGPAEDDVVVAGNAPFLVDEGTGTVMATGTAEPVERYIENYLRTGDPHGLAGFGFSRLQKPMTVMGFCKRIPSPAVPTRR